MNQPNESISCGLITAVPRRKSIIAYKGKQSTCSAEYGQGVTREMTRLSCPVWFRAQFAESDHRAQWQFPSPPATHPSVGPSIAIYRCTALWSSGTLCHGTAAVYFYYQSPQQAKDKKEVSLVRLLANHLWHVDKMHPMSPWSDCLQTTCDMLTKRSQCPRITCSSFMVFVSKFNNRLLVDSKKVLQPKTRALFCVPLKTFC